MNKIFTALLSILLLCSFALFPGCSSSGKNISSNKKIDTLQKETPPSVNSASINAEITAVNNVKKLLVCNLKILKINYYGSSVPPLAVGSIIKADISQSVISNSKISKEELLKKDSQYNIILEHFMLPPGVEGPSWKILSIK